MKRNTCLSRNGLGETCKISFELKQNREKRENVFDLDRCKRDTCLIIGFGDWEIVKYFHPYIIIE